MKCTYFTGNLLSFFALLLCHPELDLKICWQYTSCMIDVTDVFFQVDLWIPSPRVGGGPYQPAGEVQRPPGGQGRQQKGVGSGRRPVGVQSSGSAEVYASFRLYYAL